VLQTAETFQAQLASIQSESRVSPSELEEERLRAEQIRRAKQEAVRIRLANEGRPSYHRLVEHFLGCGQRYAKVVDAALELDEELKFDERFWQFALIGVHLQKKNLEAIASIGRSFARIPALARTARILWPNSLARRCNETLDGLEDLEETIGLGLNAEFREELLRRYADLPDDVKA